MCLVPLRSSDVPDVLKLGRVGEGIIAGEVFDLARENGSRPLPPERGDWFRGELDESPNGLGGSLNAKSGVLGSPS